MTSLAVLVASGGRPSLERTLASIGGQLRPGDELLVDVNDDAPWGHRARNRLMGRARADWLLFMDDDDIYEDGALEVVRAGVGERGRGVFHLFRMVYGSQYAYTEPGSVLWSSRRVALGNVSTQMVVVPNVWPLALSPDLPAWGDRYEGDFDFIQACEQRWGEPVWHEDVIAVVRPA